MAGGGAIRSRQEGRRLAMHFCSDELAMIVNALQTSPVVYLHWARAWIGRVITQRRFRAGS